MKIKEVPTKKFRFATLEVGSIFRYQGNLYMKMYLVGGYNCVLLISGVCNIRLSDDLVESVDGHFVEK